MGLNITLAQYCSIGILGKQKNSNVNHLLAFGLVYKRIDLKKSMYQCVFLFENTNLWAIKYLLILLVFTITCQQYYSSFMLWKRDIAGSATVFRVFIFCPDENNIVLCFMLLKQWHTFRVEKMKHLQVRFFLDSLFVHRCFSINDRLSLINVYTA